MFCRILLKKSYNKFMYDIDFYDNYFKKYKVRFLICKLNI